MTGWVSWECGGCVTLYCTWFDSRIPHVCSDVFTTVKWGSNQLVNWSGETRPSHGPLQSFLSTSFKEKTIWNSLQYYIFKNYLRSQASVQKLKCSLTDVSMISTNEIYYYIKYIVQYIWEILLIGNFPCSYMSINIGD